MDTQITPTAGRELAVTEGLGPARGQKLLAAFLAGRNERTRRAYAQDLEDFASFLGTPDVRAAVDHLLSQSPGGANGTVLDYRNALKDGGLAAATINRRLAAIRSVTKLARTVGFISWTLEIQGEKAEPYRDTRGPGRAGYVAMLQALEQRGDDAKRRRDEAMIRLLYDLALRRAEVVGLDVEDLDIEGGVVAVKGKGREAKELRTLPEATADALAGWLEVRGPEPGPLFLNLDPARKGDGRLTGTSLYRIVRRLGKKAGIKARPHGLRHAAITEALDLTQGNVRAVQRFSRHRDLRTLNIYDDNREDLAGDVARLVAGAATRSARAE